MNSEKLQEQEKGRARARASFKSKKKENYEWTRRRKVMSFLWMQKSIQSIFLQVPLI